MKIVYEQKTGKISAVSKDGEAKRLGVGYAGHPPYVNDADAQALKARGPIPRGHYGISYPWNHVRLGACSMFLEPLASNDMMGRSGFFIHGDNSYGNNTASHGCIVASRKIRDEIATLRAAHPDLSLEVIEG